VVNRVVLVLALAAAAQQQAAGSLREPLRPLEFLVGSCWTGTFPRGTSTDTHCFESVFDGQFVRDRHVVRYTYWASDGGLSTGTMEPGKGEIVFSESYASETGGMKMRNVWTPTGADSYDVVLAQWKDGEWRDMWRMTMHREKR
jgi:hypothetical protein